MDIFYEFATDEKKENEGAWVDLGKGAKVKVARANNPKFVKEFRDLLEKNADTLKEGGEKADKLSETLWGQAAAKYILVGFEGVTYKGKPMKYSVENAMKLLEIRDFSNLIATHSSNLDNYRVSTEEALGKG